MSTLWKSTISKLLNVRCIRHWKYLFEMENCVREIRSGIMSGDGYVCKDCSEKCSDELYKNC